MCIRDRLHSERAQIVLDCVFEDENVRNALGAAQQLKVIDGNVFEAAPGLLTALKDGPGAHIKTHYYDYTKAVKKEMARIRRIQDLQARVIGFMAMGIGALGVGIANFMSNVFYNKIAYDQYFPSDVGAADA